MKSKDEILSIIIEQVEHWLKIGKIGYIDRETVEEAAEFALSSDELDIAYGNDLIRYALMRV